jgi:hypothetical protein
MAMRAICGGVVSDDNELPPSANAPTANNSATTPKLRQKLKLRRKRRRSSTISVSSAITLLSQAD